METVDERLEGEKEVAWPASERDGDLLDASSMGESIPGVNHPVESVDLVDLQGPDKCRHFYIGTLADGSKARLCCGRSISRSAVSTLRSAWLGRIGGCLGGKLKPRLVGALLSMA